VQFLSPLVIAMGFLGPLGGESQTIVRAGQTVTIWAQNAAFIWVPWIALTSVLAWFFMNDIASAKASFSDQAVIFKRRHNWIMCWLYLGTFGSFIGFAAGFPLLIKSQFPAINALQYAWLGPLLGAIVRPFGGWLSDKLGGARVTFWVFVVLMLGVFGVLAFLPEGGQGGSFPGFFTMFLILFVATGVGNGSTFRMIPVIFLTERQREAAGKGAAALAQATHDGNKEAAAVLGFSGAIGAYGGFFIPKSYGTSIATFGGPEQALYAFIVFYLTCVALTWWFYSRRNAPMPC
jgi:NNP family nitrate/nitrite transporter-like MFS transporter